MQVKFHVDLLARRMLFDSTTRQPLGLGNDESRVENAYRCVIDMYTAGIPMLVGSDSSGQGRGSLFGLGMHIEIHVMIHKSGIEAVDVLKWCYFINCGSLWLRRGRIKMGGKLKWWLLRVMSGSFWQRRRLFICQCVECGEMECPYMTMKMR